MNELEHNSISTQRILSNARSINHTTGAQVVNGGIGVGRNIYVKDEVNANEIIARSDAKVSGNLYVHKKLSVDTMFHVDEEQIVFKKDIVPSMDGLSLGSGVRRWSIFADEIDATNIRIDSIDLVELSATGNVSLGTNTSNNPLLSIDSNVPDKVTINGDLTVTGSFKSVTVIETNQMDDLTITDSLDLTGATIIGISLDHHELIGLGDDDHTQYLNLNGRGSGQILADATGSTSSSTGALRVTGGVGIGENLYVNGKVAVSGELDVTGATLTGFSKFGWEYQLFSGSIITSTTGTVFIPHISSTTTSLVGGTYRIGWTYKWAYDNTTYDFLARIIIDGSTVVHEKQHEPSDGAGTPGDTSGIGGIAGSGTNQVFTASGFEEIVLSSGTHTIVLEHASSFVPGGTSTIKDGRIELWRVI